MRPLRPEEIQLLSETLTHLEGARLQNVFTSTKDIVFEFWMRGDTYFLWFEDSTIKPFLTFWPGKLPFHFPKKTIPLLLFLKAHFVGKHLRHVSFYPEFGRLLKLHFQDDFHLEFRIFPHGPNVIASTLEKSMSLHKPKPLQEVPNTAPSEDLRSVEEFSLEWFQFHTQGKLHSKKPVAPEESRADQSVKEFNKKVQKLERAVQKVSEELERKDAGQWIEAGEWLKNHRDLHSLPMEFEPFVDRKRSLNWNVDHIFTKAKDFQRKKEGTEKRVQELKAELRQLRERGPENFSASASGPKKNPVQDNQLKSPVKARTLVLDSDVRVMSGKTAKDNLSLLRQARGWDLWFHLKDIPSSHAVVFRPKNRKLSHHEEEKVVQWFFEQNFGQKLKNEIGNRYEVLIAECRFVRPIKGDRVGRVNYHNEKVMRFEVKGP